MQNISVPAGVSEAEIISLGLKRAGITGNVLRCGIHKISLDARKRSDIRTVSSVWAELESDALEKKICRSRDNCVYIDITPFKPSPRGKIKPEGRIAVCGFGPAGMFAALVLAQEGYCPLVLERGADIDRRRRAVEGFWQGGEFSSETNVQFGEGGAGTFSDGKLTTRIKDPLCRYVSARFAEFGAPPEILTRAKPHIGTDKLRDVVKNIRHRITELGGEVRFDSAVTDISVDGCGKLRSLTVNNSEDIAVSAAVLAVGHSARDTFEMLCRREVYMEPKPFAVGARIEHLQKDVDISLYGSHAGDSALPVGEYQMSYTRNGRGVYTFCMCPGGTVVPAQSERETVVTNGMSEFARDGRNANAALVVSVSPSDYGSGILDGVEFARSIERAAYALSGSYKAPCVTVGAFLDGRADMSGASVIPSYAAGTVPCNFEKILPAFVTDMMKTGIGVFSKRMKCFADMGAVLTAPETRTSSPVRIKRGGDMCSLTAKGLYPCGEGAGYAGGIMSAAVDGVKQACAVMDVYRAK